MILKKQLTNISPTHRLLLAIIVCVLAVFAVRLTSVHAQSSNDIQNNINELTRKNNQDRAEVDRLRELATSYEDAIAILEKNIADKEQSIKLSKQNQKQLEREIVEAEKELAKQKKLLGDNIRMMYIEGNVSTLEMLASSNNLSDFVDKRQYRESIERKVKEIANKIEELKAQKEKDKQQIDIEIRDQEDSQAKLAASSAEKARLLALNESERASLNKNIKSNEAKLAELLAEQERLRNQIQTGNLVSQGRVHRGDVLGFVGNTGYSFGAHLHYEVIDRNGNIIDPLPYYNGANGWSKPVAGGFISQYYGASDILYSGGHHHSGMDIAGVTGKAVLAVADGDIIKSCNGYCGGYGNNVVVRHDNGMSTRYAHMRD